MTPFDETTWTINDSVLSPAHIAPADTRPQSLIGIAALSMGITSWAIIALFFAGVRSPYGGYSMVASTTGAIVFGVIGVAPAVTRRGVRRGAAIAGLVLGLAVVAGLALIVGIAIYMFSSGAAQLG